MSVTLSLFAGAGAQFLDNNGNLLSGGLIYTYSAGTTTPLATYTSTLGNISHPNPIVLDSAGRIPGGELWLSTGFGYKFVTKDSNNVLIGTYDNIPSSAQPFIINDADSISYEQGYTVTAGSFIVGKTYRIATIGSTNFQLIGASSNTVGVLFIATGVGSGTGTAELSQTVENKLQQYVSVIDFGADPTGTIDSSAAIQAALNICDAGGDIGGGRTVFIPHGDYLIGTTLLISPGTNLVGESIGRSFGINYGVTLKAMSTLVDPSPSITTPYILRANEISRAPTNAWAYRVQVKNIRFEGSGTKTENGYWVGVAAEGYSLSTCTFTDLDVGVKFGTAVLGAQIPAYAEALTFYNVNTCFNIISGANSMRLNNMQADKFNNFIIASNCGASFHLGVHQLHLEVPEFTSTEAILLDTCTGGFYSISEVDVDSVGGSTPATWTLVKMLGATGQFPRVKIVGAACNNNAYYLFKDLILSNDYLFDASRYQELSYNMYTYTGQGQGALIDNTKGSLTWTPVIADAATGGNVATFNLSGATYVYNRGAVTVSFNASQINTSGMTAGNQVFIRGLPYASSQQFNAQYGSCFTGNVTNALNICNIPYFSQYVNVNKSSGGNILVSDITSPNGQINFTITYIIA